MLERLELIVRDFEVDGLSMNVGVLIEESRNSVKYNSLKTSTARYAFFE